MNWSRLIGRAAVTGSAASLSSCLALAATARAEGRGALQPLNATSHWLHGPGATERRSADAEHTGVGYATHHAATFFWAVLFETWIESRPPSSVPQLARDAAIMSAVAAAADYVATPKRFTPGWEFVLSKRSMALAYAGMAVGLAAGAYASAATRSRSRVTAQERGKTANAAT